jgi:hypothetical protein
VGVVDVPLALIEREPDRPAEEADHHPPDDSGVGSALDTTTDEDSDSSDDETERKSSASFNAPPVLVPYDGAMAEFQLQEVLNRVPTLSLTPSFTFTPAQRTLISRSVEVLEKTYKVHMLRPEAGSGKTLCAIAIAQLLNLMLVVVRPHRITSWSEETKRCGMSDVLQMGYEALRSVRGRRDPTHGLLTRMDVPVVSRGRKRKHRSESESETESEHTPIRTRTRPTFTTTIKYAHMLQAGILLVVDESHRCKKASDRSAAVSALVNELVSRPGHRSRCLMLSATPFEHREHVLAVSQGMGLIASVNGPFIRDCRLVHLCQQFEPNHKLLTNKVLNNIFSRPQKISLVYKLFVHVISPRLASTSTRIALPVNMDVRNGMYRMPKDDEYRLRHAMAEARNDEHEGGQRLNKISEAVIGSQVFKASTVVRLVRQTFLEDPGCCVAVMGQCIEALFAIAIQLEDMLPVYKSDVDGFSPVKHVLWGKNTLVHQQRLINEFQAGTSRLLIANLSVSGEGLNLQDKVGNRKRYVFILPSLHASSMIQAFYRFYRMDTKSDVVVRVVWCLSRDENGHVVNRERLLVDNHKRADRVLRALLPQQDQEGAQFFRGIKWFHESSDHEE